MKNSVESLGRIRLQGIVLLLVTFAVGVLAGLALERVMAARRPPRFMPPMSMGQPWAKGPLPPMFAELELTTEQQSQIRDIMERSRPRSEELLQQTMPRLRALTDSVRMEIQAVLTPEQAARLDSLMTRRGRGPGRMPGMQGPDADRRRPRDR